jgi:hypothetical protein
MRLSSSCGLHRDVRNRTSCVTCTVRSAVDLNGLELFDLCNAVRRTRYTPISLQTIGVKGVPAFTASPGASNLLEPPLLSNTPLRCLSVWNASELAGREGWHFPRLKSFLEKYAEKCVRSMAFGRWLFKKQGLNSSRAMPQSNNFLGFSCS